MADAIKDSMPGYPQGEPAFVGMLKEHVAFVPHWDDAKCGKNELDAKAGIRLDAAVVRYDMQTGRALEIKPISIMYDPQNEMN